MGDLILNCPGCGRANDRHAAQSVNATPEDGDYSLCWKCGLIGVFVGTPATSVRLPTDEELDEISKDPLMIAASFSVQFHSNVTDAIDNWRSTDG